MVDVLFVNPPSPDGHIYIRDINRSGRRSRERTIWPQTSLAYLAAVMKDEGYSVGLIDCIALEMGWKEFRKYLEEKKPRYIVINVISSIITNDLHASYLGKFMDSRTIAIGPHITELPVETMERFPSIDYGILGEAEVTVKELINAVERKENLADVKGIVYRDRGEIKKTPKRDLIEDLDQLPIPLHELLPIDKYSLPYIGKRYTFVLASRGCPYLCTFCRQPIMWQRKVRTRTPESIMKELRYLKGIGVTNIMFHSDTFTIDKGIVIKLCQMMVDEGLKLRWCCNSRVDTVDDEMLMWMKRAGCWMIAYGIETGSQKILENVKKGAQATVVRAEKAIRETRSAGIKAWGYFIFGLPGETRQTISQTIGLAKRLHLDFVNFAVGAPYPGTEFYRQAKENGWLQSERWEDFDQNYSAIVGYPDLSTEEIIKAVRKGYLSWYLTSRGIFMLLKGFTSLSYIRTLLIIGFQHLAISKSEGKDKC
jgi:anaerobic magnesium-protoporphyrin IX monomethyl ester cyclase